MKRGNALKYLYAVCLIISLVYSAGAALYAKDVKYDKQGIIAGNDASMRNAPDGKVIKSLKEGEVVFIKNKKNHKSSYWYNIVTLQGKTGWIEERSVSSLDKNRVPDKYYAQLLPKRIYHSGYSLYNVKFEFYKEYNMLIFRYFLEDDEAYMESMELCEIKNDRARPASYNHFYNSRVLVCDKYAFVMGNSEVDVYNRLQLDSLGEYKMPERFPFPNYDGLGYNSSSLDFNRADNCYYLKINYGGQYGTSIHEDIYRFDGKTLVKVR